MGHTTLYLKEEKKKNDFTVKRFLNFDNIILSNMATVSMTT